MRAMPISAVSYEETIHFDVVSLDRKCVGASVRDRYSLPLLLPRGIFDKETRRKAVAVAGAAMELEPRIGLRKSGKEAG
jgi:hypothetical protein